MTRSEKISRHNEIAILLGCYKCGRRVCDLETTPKGNLLPVPIGEARLVYGKSGKAKAICGECQK